MFGQLTLQVTCNNHVSISELTFVRIVGETISGFCGSCGIFSTKLARFVLAAIDGKPLPIIDGAFHRDTIYRCPNCLS